MAARLQYHGIEMRCPECSSLNEDGAAACSNCGLLLLNSAPRRRSEDLAVQRRRSSDQETEHCRFCNGIVEPHAIRCVHCSEVLDDDFYRSRATRLRTRINYASWVMYLFGLGALLVFRPVGVLSIAAGLLLSIIYYAIPVEPLAPGRSGKKPAIGEALKRQLKLERVGIPLPGLRNAKMIFVGTPLIAAMIGYSANLFLLQEPVNDILNENASFAGMKVSAHYKYWVVPGVVVYDLEQLSFRQTPIDVQTAFLEFANRLKEKRYSRVDLSYAGTTKFSLDGAAFAQLGREYEKRNFEFTLYEFPLLLRAASGTRPISPRSAGRDALLEFHRSWYGDDQLTGTVANAFVPRPAAPASR